MILLLLAQVVDFVVVVVLCREELQDVINVVAVDTFQVLRRESHRDKVASDICAEENPKLIRLASCVAEETSRKLVEKRKLRQGLLETSQGFSSPMIENFFSCLSRLTFKAQCEARTAHGKHMFGFLKKSLLTGQVQIKAVFFVSLLLFAN